MQSESRQCRNCQKSFGVEGEDFEFYKKIEVPAPTWCPLCRAQRRIMWRAEKALYKRKSDLTGKEIFSTFHQQAPVKVYENEYWWSDKWDAGDYAREVDWNKPFLTQVKELMEVVPVPARSVTMAENSEYSNNAGFLKNCYLVFSGNKVENSFYTVGIEDSRECMDCNYVFSSELCYWCVRCRGCYRSAYSVECENSSDLFFCKNLINCSDCFGCVNVRNKKYCIFNQQYTEKEYTQKIQEFRLNTYSGVQEAWKQVLEFQMKFPVKFAHETQAEFSSGDYLTQCRNVTQSYFVSHAENVKYSQMVMVATIKDSYDYSFWGSNAELLYECCNVGIDVSRLKFCFEMYPNCSEMEYSMYCTASSNLFGCIGLKKKQFCILNKQYTEEEYRELVPKLRQHMIDMPYTDSVSRTYPYGEFFPPEFLPFGYNETLAYELFPMTKEQAIAQGLPWRDAEERTFSGLIPATDIPDDIM